MAARAPARRAERGTDVTSPSGRTSYFSGSQGRALTHADSQERVHKFRQQGRDVGYRPPGGSRYTARLPQDSLPGKTYHRIVLAEFVGCIVLVGASPVLTPRTKAKGSQQVVDTTVSFAAPLVRLTAVCIVFFILALMATGPRSGKVAAAFGGLVLLGTMLNATSMFTAIGKVFGPAKAASTSTTTGTAAGAGAAAGAAAGSTATPGATLGIAQGSTG